MSPFMLFFLYLSPSSFLVGKRKIEMTVTLLNKRLLSVIHPLILFSVFEQYFGDEIGC